MLPCGRGIRHQRPVVDPRLSRVLIQPWRLFQPTNQPTCNCCNAQREPSSTARLVIAATDSPHSTDGSSIRPYRGSDEFRAILIENIVAACAPLIAAVDFHTIVVQVH